MAELVVSGTKVSLGRDAGCDLVIDGPTVAALHAELRLRGGVWWLSDLGTEQGTWVDGERVTGTSPVAPGSVLKLGGVALVFSPRDSWADSTPPADVLPPLPMTVGWEPRDEPMAPEFAWPLRHSESSLGWYLGVAVLTVALIVTYLVWGR